MLNALLLWRRLTFWTYETTRGPRFDFLNGRLADGAWLARFVGDFELFCSVVAFVAVEVLLVS